MAREGAGTYNYKPEWQSLPKTGEGSEFNRDNREMARRKKYGFHSKGHSVDDLPWILNVKGENVKEKQFRAKRSVSDNSSYFIFINNAEIGGFEAYPLEDWYTFVPYRTFKTLTIEEAEEEFSKRHKILNKYSIMANRRKAEQDKEDEVEDKSEKTKKKGTASLKKVEEINEFIESGDDGENLSDDDENERVDEDGSDDEKDKKQKKTKARSNNDDENEAQVNEESDDGDHEGDELDYTSSESDGGDSDFETTKNVEKYEEKGIDEEGAIKAMEEEDEDGEDEEDKKLTEEGKDYKRLISKTTLKDEDDDVSKDSAKKSSDSKYS